MKKIYVIIACILNGIIKFFKHAMKEARIQKEFQIMMKKQYEEWLNEDSNNIT
jgi:hypothetical protein